MKRQPVDQVRVARARKGLDEAIRRSPHLVGPRAQARLAAYLEEEGEHMARKDDSVEKVQVAIRFTEAMIARLDAVAVKLSRPGLKLTRADAIRIAIESGLPAIEKEK
jgi:hypothetical protein